MQSIPHSNQFATSDLALAATLSLWVTLENIDRTNPRRAVFEFPQSDELDRLIELYWRGQLEVEPQLYFGQLRSLKSRLHEADQP